MSYSLMLENNINYIKNTVNFVILSLGFLWPLDQVNTSASISCSQSVFEVGLWLKIYIYLPWNSNTPMRLSKILCCVVLALVQNL